LRADDEPRLPADAAVTGTNAAAKAGEIGEALVDSFDLEARRRVASGMFYGAMLFLSLNTRKDAV